MLLLGRANDLLQSSSWAQSKFFAVLDATVVDPAHDLRMPGLVVAHFETGPVRVDLIRADLELLYHQGGVDQLRQKDGGWCAQGRLPFCQRQGELLGCDAAIQDSRVVHPLQPDKVDRWVGLEERLERVDGTLLDTFFLSHLVGININIRSLFLLLR